MDYYFDGRIIKSVKMSKGNYVDESGEKVLKSRVFDTDDICDAIEIQIIYLQNKLDEIQDEIEAEKKDAYEDYQLDQALDREAYEKEYLK